MLEGSEWVQQQSDASWEAAGPAGRAGAGGTVYVGHRQLEQDADVGTPGIWQWRPRIPDVISICGEVVAWRLISSVIMEDAEPGAGVSRGCVI